MSKEFITDVLDKFAQITSILVETSKIKEYLDSKCVSDNDLSIILEKTKKEVDNLSEQSQSVKDLFYKQYKEVSSQLNSVNGKIHSDEQQNGVISDAKDPLESDKTPDISNGQDSELGSKSLTDKPLIKLVDINKLVEPKSLIKKEFLPAREKKSVEFDTTVVIITSSDEEPVRTTITTESKVTRVRRKVAKETLRKTRLSLQLSNSDSDSFSDSENVTNTNKFRCSGRTPKLDEKITVSDTLSGLDDSSSDSSMKLSDIANKTKEKTSKNETEAEPSALEPEPEFDWKNDPKFKAGCYIKILRIPCEKLKEYYLEKLELLQINRLCDINTLKRKRTNNESGTEKSLDSDKDEEKKESKKKRSNPSIRNNTSDSDTSDDEPLINKTNNEEIPGKDSNHEEEKNMEADLAMDMLHSDQDDADENDSDDEASTRVKESTEKHECDVEKDEKEENENGKTDASEPADEADKVTSEKSSEDKDEEKTNEDDGKEETAGKKFESEKETTSDHEKEQQENKEKDVSKKKWRRDKLLTDKLSSSDSEEDFKKFCKKKEQIEEQVMSDDEPQIVRDKKKRMVKKRLKKAILSDSDFENDKKSDDDFQKPSQSSSSSSESEKEKQEEPKKPIRKRVKRVKDSSEEDDGEKSTRKQIRNIWGRDSLAETTKKAEAEEAERKARIAEKQKKYNQIYETNAEINAKVEKVVLDFDEKSNKELLKIADELVPKLKPHQASGIQFMWDACFESLERAKTTKGSGCILAHCMGLGKTLQVIALTHTLLINQEKTNVKKVMVVSPLNTVLNWVNEYKQWLPDLEEFEIFELVSFKQNYERMYQVKNWHNFGGVLIIGYDMFRNLSNPENKRISKKMRTTFQEALVDPGPDLVICDEGHLLKNEKTHLSIAMNRLKTLRRIVLTGTPLQNNLKEYFCMVQFIKPNLLGTYKEYLNRFVNPITNGQYTDSTPHDIQVMRRRSHVLHKMLDGIVQRRDYSVLQPYLPPKYEYVLFLNLSEVQIKLYRHYMDHFAKRSLDGSNRTSFLFVDFQALQRICTHPRVLLDRSIEMRNAKDKLDDSEEDSEGSLKDFINDDEEETSSTNSSSNSDSEEDGKKNTTSTRKRVTRATAALAKETGEEIEPITVEETQKEWWQEYCDGDELNVIAHSSKLFLLFEILKECEQIGDKVLVFSQSLYSLNIIEYFLGRVHDATEADETDTVGGYSGSWCLGLDYFRLDGSSSCDNRTSWCKTFNNPSNTRARLFLISTKAGGLGINLVAANRVIIFDVSWNPSHDIQSIYRVYRFGQTKPCYIYRFVTYGTMEMKIYERQVTKQAISKRVIDEQQIDRHYNQNDLAELYRFDPYPEVRPTPLVPKDVLLGELLQRFEDRIYKYHEHQSLLENKEEEGLNEEERKAAWEEFENEKKQRFTIGTNLVRMPNIEIALMNIVRKDNPTWNETQIRAMLPALQVQYQETLSKGDLSIHRRVQQELQIIQALQNQKLREQFYQQQLRLFQQQQLAGLRLPNPASYMNQFMHNMPGSSRNNLNNLRTAQSGLGSSEVIDLND